MAWERVGGLMCLALAMLLPVSAARADDAETRRAIGRLIEVGWSTAPAARGAADAAFREESAAIAGDLRALEAWTLILLQQRRYDEASKRVDQWLAKDGEDLFALRARVWLWAMLKNYPAAMSSAERLAEKVGGASGATLEQKEQLDELTAFLGRIYGFLGGPAAAAVSQEDRKSSERRLASRLGAERAEGFAKARDAVLQQHLELSDSKTAEREKARDAGSAEREKTLKEIAAERDSIARRGSEINTEREKLRDTMNTEMEEVRKQERPLALQYAQLDAQAAAINRERGPLVLQIQRLEFDASRQEDPALRNQLLNDADRLRVVASRLNAQLQTVQRLGAALQQQRAALAAQLQDIQRNYGGQIGELDREMQGFAKREKRLAADEVRAKKPVSGTTGQVLSLAAQAAALSTYDTLPLEEEKERILGELQ